MDEGRQPLIACYTFIEYGEMKYEHFSGVKDGVLDREDLGFKRWDTQCKLIECHVKNLTMIKFVRSHPDLFGRPYATASSCLVKTMCESRGKYSKCATMKLTPTMLMKGRIRAA